MKNKTLIASLFVALTCVIFGTLLAGCAAKVSLAPAADVARIVECMKTETCKNFPAWSAASIDGVKLNAWVSFTYENKDYLFNWVKENNSLHVEVKESNASLSSQFLMLEFVDDESDGKVDSGKTMSLPYDKQAYIKEFSGAGPEQKGEEHRGHYQKEFNAAIAVGVEKLLK